MSQHDGVLSNDVGAAFRADINAALAAIFGNHSGASEPTVMYAYQFWADTTAGIMKQRNAANTAWIPRFMLAAVSGADIASAATVDLSAEPSGSLVTITGTTATSAFTMNDGQTMTLVAAAAWVLTNTATTCEVLGGADYTCEAGDTVTLTKTGGVVRAFPRGLATRVTSGIKFPATQVPSAEPNTLDDYEEGDWTPVVLGTTVSGTTTYSLQVGRYTKVGQLVTVQGVAVWSGMTGTGDLRLWGLPFTSGSSSQVPLQCIPYQITYTGTIITALIGASATYADILQTSSGAALTGIPVDTSGRLYVSGSYIV